MRNNNLKKHNLFLLKQLELTSRKIIIPIYRGDSLTNLCARLNIAFNGELINDKELLKRLFMVGDKAQSFLGLDNNFIINGIDDFVFEKIFEYCSDTLRNKNPYKKAYLNRKSEFQDFFSVRSNKEEFLRIVNSAPEIEKIGIRNYYLTLLHQLAAINYKRKSHFISTTEDYIVAQNFTNQNEENDRIILHCWQPIKKEINLIKKFKLPQYYSFPYPYQKEISLIGGILPHFISGIELKINNRFYPNPYIFNSVISEEIFLNGLEIDQYNFDNVLQKTNYLKSFVIDGENISEQIRH